MDLVAYVGQNEVDLEAITWTTVRVRLGDLKPWADNPKSITKAAANRLLKSWREYGQVQTIAVSPSLQVLDGHQRLNVLLAAYGADYVVDARQASRELSEDEKKRLVVYLHAGAVGSWDWDALSSWSAPDLMEWGMDSEALAGWKRDVAGLKALTASEGEDVEDEQEQDDDQEDLPFATDYIFPTDNEFEIPVLDEIFQPLALELPVIRWGRQERHGKAFSGTVHFYTEDYKFNAIWKDPSPPFMAGVTCAIEPNYSTNEQMPFPVALWGIYKKRWLSRFWQLSGIKIIVDLNVDPKFEQINLLGVPKGWRAYSTRFYKGFGEGDVIRQYELAKAHAGRDDILFIVVGGGKTAFDLCKQHGFTYIQQENHVVEGRNYGT